MTKVSVGAISIEERPNGGIVIGGLYQRRGEIILEHEDKAALISALQALPTDAPRVLPHVIADADPPAAIEADLRPIRISVVEAQRVMGALNVTGMLRNTLAPVTQEQLDEGTMDRALAMRLLEAMAALEPPEAG
jgi:hypothetical protein